MFMFIDIRKYLLQFVLQIFAIIYKDHEEGTSGKSISLKHFRYTYLESRFEKKSHLKLDFHLPKKWFCLFQ